MALFPLAIVVEMLAALILVVLGAMRSRFVRALCFVVGAGVAFGVCAAIGLSVPRLAATLHMIGLILSGLILFTGFIRLGPARIAKP